MHSLIEYYGKQIMQAMEETPEAEKICNMWERGYITYAEAIKELLKAVENNQYVYIIQYKGYMSKRYNNYCDTEYTFQEATEELERLRTTAPGFMWRYRKERRATA